MNHALLCLTLSIATTLASCAGPQAIQTDHESAARSSSGPGGEATLSGSVRDGKGVAAGGLRIVANKGEARVETFSDAAGTYRFEGLDGGGWTITAQRGRFVASSFLRLGETEQARRNLELFRPVTARFRVLDDAGSAIEGATIRIWRRAHLEELRTDENGEAETRFMKPGTRHSVEARLRGHTHVRGERRILLTGESLFEHRLERHVMLSGQVLGVDGQPAARARIAMSSEETRADASGRFTLTAQLMDPPFLLAEARDRRSLVVMPLSLRPGSTQRDLVVKLRALGTVRAQVENLEGRPIEATLRLRSDDDRFFSLILDRGSEGLYLKGEARSGSIEMAGIPTHMALDALVEAPGFHPKRLDHDGAPDGSDWDLGVVRLHPLGRISGRVVGPEGLARMGVAVHLRCMISGMLTVQRVGLDGRFRFEGLPAGSYTLCAQLRAPSSTAAGTGLTAGMKGLLTGPGKPLDDLRLELRQDAVLQGVVTNVNGDPAAGLDVRLDARDLSLAVTPVARTAADGTFVIAIPGSLRCDLWFGPPGHVPDTGPENHPAWSGPNPVYIRPGQRMTRKFIR